MYEPIAFAANLIAGAAAAYTDIKTGYIYDWITYPLIGVGIILSALTGQWAGILLGAGIYILGWLAYRKGKIGGGDIKLLVGVALVQPTYEGMIFVFGVLFTGTLLACLGLSTYYVIKLLAEKKPIQWNTRRKKMGALYAGGILVYAYYAPSFVSWGAEVNAFLSAAVFAGIIFYALEEEIKKNSFLKNVEVEKLEDDEVLALEHLTTEQREKLGKNVPELIGREDILRFKHAGITHLPVYRNLPKFAPFLFAGMLITYLFPTALSTLIPAFF